MCLAESREIPAVYSNYDPAVWQAIIVPLKLLHVLKFAFRHRRQAQVPARNHLFAPIDDPQEDATLHSVTLSETHCLWSMISDDIKIRHHCSTIQSEFTIRKSAIDFQDSRKTASCGRPLRVD